MSAYPQTERRMVELTTERLRASSTRYATEVPFMGRSIDLVYEDNHGQLVTIEFKRHDWRRALDQARDHALGSERVYICVPGSRVTDSLLEAADALGVGVFEWHEDAPLNEIVGPSLESTPWPISQTWLRERFKFRYSTSPR